MSSLAALHRWLTVWTWFDAQGWRVRMLVVYLGVVLFTLAWWGLITLALRAWAWLFWRPPREATIEKRRLARLKGSSR